MRLVRVLRALTIHNAISLANLFLRIVFSTRNWHVVLLFLTGIVRTPVLVNLRSGKVMLLTQRTQEDYLRSTIYEYAQRLGARYIKHKNLAEIVYAKRRIRFALPCEDEEIYYRLLRQYYLPQYRCLRVRGRVVIDVGAYIGDTAIYFALRGAKRCYALEPHPYAYSLLLHNIRINKMNNSVVPLNIGISCSGREETMVLPLENIDTWAAPVSELASTNKQSSMNAGTKIVKVKLTTLGRLLDLLNVLSLNSELVLKMDCEGCEFSLLNESPEVLRKFREIVLEFHGSPISLLHRLVKIGFKLVEIKLYQRSPLVGVMYLVRRTNKCCSC